MDICPIVKTHRLKLLPCALEVAQAAATKNKSQVEALLAVRVPEEWYTTQVQDFLPTYAQILTNDSSQLGWGVWLIIHTADSTLIGDLGFLGKPDHSRTVEIGYEVMVEYRNQGYGFEAVQALVNWAFKQPEISRIIAHCHLDNSASIRILEKLGMQQIGRNETLPEWELKKE